MRASSRFIIGGQTIRNLLTTYHETELIPDVVEFATALSAAEEYDPDSCEWYETCLAQVLAYIGRSVQGENPDILALELFANASTSARTSA